MDNLNLCKQGFRSLLVMMVVSLALLPSTSKPEQDPSPIERSIGLTTTTFNTRWDALRTWAKIAWINLRPPASRDEGSTGSSGVMKAATRSFESGKETVADAARSAAEAAGEALEKTTDKVKETVSHARDL